MLTVQNVIDQGYAKSAAARIESIAAPAELVTRVGQCLREVFLVLSRENPNVLGTSFVMPFNGAGWSRAADCLRAIKVLVTANTVLAAPVPVGTPVAIVAYDDQGFCKGQPSLTELGQQFVPTGQGIDPSGGTLLLLYARAPIMPAQTADPIDPLFPEFFADYLASDIAAYLATKDKRSEDQAVFLSMKGAALGQIVQWARGQTLDLQARFPLIDVPLTNTNAGKQSPADGG